MPRTLSAAEARATFDELVNELVKQHLRLQFRKRFGTGELLDAKMLKRATVSAEREKPLSNLLHETPDKVLCRRLVGTSDELQGSEWETLADAKIGQLLSPEEVEQALVVQGRKARLLAYSDPTSDHLYVIRVATELFGETPEKKPREPAKLSRRKAAARAGKLKNGGKPVRRGRR